MKLLGIFLRTFLLLTIFHLGLFAAPADKTQTFSKQQSNGRTISYTLNGDEFIGWLNSIDGYTMFETSKGDIVYASKDEGGKLIKSNVLASDPQFRNADEILFLSSIQKGLFYNSSQLDDFKKKREERYSDNSAPYRTTTNNPNFLVILVNFSNMAFGSVSNATNMSNQITQANYTTNGATGSVKDYYFDNSMGALDANFVVVGPYTLSETQAYYGAEQGGSHDIRPREMVAEACSLASQDVNYADFDNDNNGFVDMIHVVYAGLGQHNGGGPNAIWAHSWSIPSSPTYNGVSLSKYSCSNELRNSTEIDGIGTICHEMGHVLGLPDFYDTDYAGTGGQSVVLESWDLMSSGNYNNDSKTPPHLSALEREMLGWLNLTILNFDSTLCTLPAISDSNKAYKVNLNSNEFFIFEHRNQKKWDKYTPGKGMLVFHGDNNLIDQWRNSRINNINVNPVDRGFFIVPAYGDSTNNTSSSTPFPGFYNVTTFIGSKLKDYSPTGKALVDISYTTDSILHFTYFNQIPTLTILPITNSSSTSVTLNAAVTGNSITSMGFEYREYGTSNFTQQLLSTNPLQLTINGLIPNTRYEYRIYLVSSIGISYSEIETFITDCGITLNPPYSENFETTLTCWNNISSTSNIFQTVQTGGLPSCSPHGGTNMLKYNSYDIGENQWTSLITPKFIFPNYFYDVNLWIYRTSGTYSNIEEGVEIYINSSKSFNGATKIGYISNNKLAEPFTSNSGWYNYSCNIGIEGVGERYIILKAISQRGYNIYIDDLSITPSQYLAPIIKTDSITNITYNSATIHASFYQGTEPVISTGIEYRQYFNNNWTTLPITTTTNQISATISQLSQNELYLVRPYVVTATGINYQTKIDSFMTQPLIPTIVITDTAIFTSPTSIVVNGSYSQGSYPVQTSGFKYKPTTTSVWTTLTQTTNNPTFSTTIDNLVANTTYQYRAFITNDMGTTYAETKVFTTETLPITLGHVISLMPETILDNDTIIMKGELIHTGNTTRNLELGFVYSNSPDPELNQPTTTKQTIPYTPTTTIFSSKIKKPCQENNSFYYRAYIKNQIGTYYGDDIIVSCTGLNLLEQNPISISLYPNPTSSRSKLQIDNVKGNIEIIIRDISGREIQRISTRANNRIETTLDLTNQSKGIYFISIVTEKTKRTEKLILK